jgi:hypothetical protein
LLSDSAISALREIAMPVEITRLKKLLLTLALGAAVLGLGACDDAGDEGAAPPEVPGDEDVEPVE